MTAITRNPHTIASNKPRDAAQPQSIRTNGTLHISAYCIMHYSSFRSKLPGNTMLPRLTVYNNAGLTFKASEEIYRESIEKCRSGQPHCRLTPLSREPPRISAKTLHCQKLESLGYIVVADSMGLSSFKFSWWAVKDACVLKQSA